MNEKRFAIDTPIGKLVAEADGDYKDYPGIYIYHRIIGEVDRY